MDRNSAKGHIEAAVTIIIWGTTFVSTKVLLLSFTPIEILFQRFILGYIALWLAYPRILGWRGWREEGVFALAGLSGICLYYLLENIALTYTSASNVGVIIAVSPFFVALLSRRHLSCRFFIGFAAALSGIAMISFSGSSLSINPIGDLLALLAAAVWGIYSMLSSKAAGYGYNALQTTRRMFMYGLIAMAPAAVISGIDISFHSIIEARNLLNLLYLGLGASALCFVTWNSAVKAIGPVPTSVYIYLVPVVTVIASAIFLGERMGPMSIAGTALTLSGLVFSQRS